MNVRTNIQIIRGSTRNLRSRPHTAQLRRPLTSSANMSAAASSKEWLVQIPDKPNALQNRLGARPTHLKNIQPRVDAGQVVLGGAVLTKHPAEGETPDMTGSVMIFKADTKEEILEILKSDEYVKQGAWDVEKAQITPFKSAIRLGL